MKRLTDRMNLAKIVLTELSQQPQRRTELKLHTIRTSGTPATFDGILKYLVEEGYIQKTEPKCRAKYRITEKGDKLLEAIA
jgi:DNA-binding PadR family transcriptional regulator